MYWPATLRISRHVPVGVGDAVERAALEHDVREDAVDPLLHLVREAFHHGVDDDHRRHAEHHADDRHQRDVARPQIPPAKQKFVHAPVLGLCQCSRQFSVVSRGKQFSVVSRHVGQFLLALGTLDPWHLTRFNSHLSELWRRIALTHRHEVQRRSRAAQCSIRRAFLRNISDEPKEICHSRCQCREIASRNDGLLPCEECA